MMRRYVIFKTAWSSGLCQPGPLGRLEGEDKKLDIQKVTPEMADKIITTRQPRGLFYTVEEVAGERVYVGIHNEDGSAWTEDFKSLTACKRWLKS
jgi:hypothetical protein